MQTLEQRVRSVALSNLPVLIEGERGTGKVTLAEQIHRLSCPEGDFLRIYCGQAEQQLFDAIRAAEAGDATAVRPRRGTLCLKHIELCPLELQLRLLRTIHTASDTKTEGNGHGPVLRLIATSVEPLAPLAARGGFLPDLYFRLAASRLSLPPLRERLQGIEGIFWSMVLESSDRAGELFPPNPELLRALKQYCWPGNLRELRDMASSYAMCRDADHIVEEIRRRSKDFSAHPSSRIVSLKDQVRSASKQLETEIIRKALEQHRWNRRRTAESLKISYRALLYKMKECNLRADATGEGD